MKFATYALTAHTFLIGSSLAATYSQKENLAGASFLNSFTYENIPDPTNGTVNYVDGPTAVQKNLTFTSSNTLIVRADSTTVLQPGGPGRNSVRLRSTRTYTTHVAVFDIRHMPQGCGTWPAVWETDEASWPNGGEIDIIEGVNDQGANAATLHTSPGCTMDPARGGETGNVVSSDCNTQVNGNQGCSVTVSQSNSYGPSFNSNGGGWYAVERTNTGIKVWFWSRNGSPPTEVRNGASTVNPDSWGTPAAYFPNTSCDIASKFSANNIIINLTFCGTWAGTVYGNSGCPSNCIDYVSNNPSAFANAYFDFASLRTYS